ncbi:MAG: roadblock/LC7 domain-containing protein [Anaerolineales bacterium]|nr:roadblock/LC7 domain-containing protein [Anaerolineales bacterium]
MADTRSTHIVNRLRDLQASAPDIIASAVVTADGLSLASALPSNIEEERVAAMSAAMLSLGERIAQELQRGNMEEVYIRGEEGLVLLTAIGRDAVLTTLARSEAKLGLMLMEMRRAAADLEPYVAP